MHHEQGTFEGASVCSLILKDEQGLKLVHRFKNSSAVELRNEIEREDFLSDNRYKLCAALAVFYAKGW